MKSRGSCLCKAVGFEFESKGSFFDACHCSMCRSWSGGPAMMVEASGNIDFTGEENVSIYSSSDWAERGFCKKCGSSLFYRMKDKTLGFCNFSLGTLENQENYEFKVQIFTDHKPQNYSFSNDTKMMTEKEVLEAFSTES